MRSMHKAITQIVEWTNNYNVFKGLLIHVDKTEWPEWFRYEKFVKETSFT